MYAQQFELYDYNVKDGLSSNYVMDICQLNSGLIVTSTSTGVSALLPGKIKTYTQQDGLLDISPTVIYAVDDYTLIVNFPTGFSILNLQTDSITNYPSSEQKAFHALSFGDGKIYTLDKVEGFTRLPALGSAITDVIRFNQKMYVSTLDSGLFSIDNKTFKVEKLPLPIRETVFNIEPYRGELYMLTANNLYKYDRETSRVESMDDNLRTHPLTGYYRHFSIDGHGYFWIGGHYTGVLRTDGHNIREFDSQQNITTSKVSSLFVDKHKNLWLGTLGQGLKMLRDMPYLLYTEQSDGLMLDNVSAYKELDDYNIIGYAPGGIQVLHHTDSSRNRYYSFYNSTLVDDNVFVLNTYRGEAYGMVFNQLFKVDKRGNLISLNDNTTPELQRGRDMVFINNKLYIASTTGLTSYDLSTKVWKTIGDLDEVYQLVVHDDKLLLTTASAFMTYDPENETFKSLSKNEAIYAYGAETERYAVQFSLAGDYLIFDKNNGSTLKAKLYGVSGSVQAAMTIDNTLYLFTDGDYYIIDIMPEEKEVLTIRESGRHGYDVFSNAISYFNSTIYVGTSNGLMFFDPDFKPTSAKAPDLMLKLPEGYEREDSTLIIPRYARAESLDLFALDYDSRHSTKLDVYLNGKLVTTAANNLTLADNFSPGSNQLEIVTSDDTGNTKRMNLTVIKVKYWYETLGFIIFSVILILVALFLLYRWLRKRRDYVIQQEEHKKRKIEEELRESIAMDFHDELGNNLAVLNVNIEKLNMVLKGAERNLIDDIRGAYKKVFDNSKDLAWALNPASDNIEEILLRGKDYGQKLFAESGIAFKCLNKIDAETNLALKKSGAAKDLLYIIKESFTNAYKHSQATEVIFEVVANRKGKMIRISDNGSGNELLNNKGRGKRYMRKRADRIGAELTISGSKNGTSIELKEI